MLYLGDCEAYPKRSGVVGRVGVDVNTVPYNFEFWNEYTQFCRKLASEAMVSMRELDRALWKYSKEKQNAGSE